MRKTRVEWSEEQTLIIQLEVSGGELLSPDSAGELDVSDHDGGRARRAELWNLSSLLDSWAMSLTILWKGSFLMSRSVLLWYFLISLMATVPGLNLWAFLTPPIGVFLVLLAPVSFLGFLMPEWLFLAVVLVLAILAVIMNLNSACRLNSCN